VNFSDDTDRQAEMPLNPAGWGAVPAIEAGVPFQPLLGNTAGIDPIVKWLSLMEVV
jgi:hypothetical protein